MLQLGLFKLLKDDATVSGLVGTRIYPSVKPQSGTFPCIIYTRTNGNWDYHFKGSSGLIFSRLQIDVDATAYPLTKQIQSAIIDVLKDYKGTVSGSGWSCRFDGIFLNGRNDETVKDSVGGVDRVFRTSFDLDIWHT